MKTELDKQREENAQRKEMLWSSSNIAQKRISTVQCEDQEPVAESSGEAEEKLNSKKCAKRLSQTAPRQSRHASRFFFLSVAVVENIQKCQVMCFMGQSKGPTQTHQQTLKRFATNPPHSMPRRMSQTQENTERTPRVMTARTRLKSMRHMYPAISRPVTSPRTRFCGVYASCLSRITSWLLQRCSIGEQNRNHERATNRRLAIAFEKQGPPNAHQKPSTHLKSSFPERSERSKIAQSHPSIRIAYSQLP